MTTHDQNSSVTSNSVKDQLACAGSEKITNGSSYNSGGTMRRRYTTWKQYGVEWKAKPPRIEAVAITDTPVDYILDVAEDIGQWEDDDMRFNTAVLLIRGVTGALFTLAESAGDPSMAINIISELMAEKLEVMSHQERQR